MRFEFSTASRIIFGSGRLSEVGPVARVMGNFALLVTGQTPSRAVPLMEIMNKEGIGYACFSTHAEPTIKDIRQGTEFAMQKHCDLIIGFGGGSAIDTAKAIAAILGNGGDPLDYLEIVGNGNPITRPSIPWIAIPTTAGSGAEVTSNAVISSPEHLVKVSLRSPLMLAGIVLVDPELTCSLPPALTASTGLDALTQLIEPYVSIKSNPLTDSICREGIRRVAGSLIQAYKNGNDTEAREDMSIASLFGGLALSNSKLGAVHGIAGPMGGMIRAPHGNICARLLPNVMEANIKLLKARLPGSMAINRYDEIAQLLTMNIKAKASDGVNWVKEIFKVFNIPPLSYYGLTPEIFPDLTEKASKASSMQGNPIKLTFEEIMNILEGCFI
ncbi:MAG: iron-containing alcohol dehydrogenase [bacterium]